MRNSARDLILLVLFVALISAFVGFSTLGRRRAFEYHERFAVTWQTHDMLAKYITEHNGQWPRSWDDLQESFVSTNYGYGAPSLDWLRDRIEVDFDFDPDSVASTEQANDNAFQVLRLPNAVEDRETREANRRLRITLQSYRK